MLQTKILACDTHKQKKDSAKTGKRHPILKIGALNVRTLRQASYLSELEDAFEKLELIILELSETRREEKRIIIMGKGSLFYHMGG